MIEAVWDERRPSTATHQVRKIVPDLRHRLPGGDRIIRTDGPGYRLTIADDPLDLRAFDAYIAARVAGSAAARSTRCGRRSSCGADRPLAGLDGPTIIPAAMALDERRLAVLEQLMELRLDAGEARGPVAELQELVAEHPLRETLRGQPMVALSRAGRPSCWPPAPCCCSPCWASSRARTSAPGRRGSPAGRPSRSAPGPTHGARSRSS